MPNFDCAYVMMIGMGMDEFIGSTRALVQQLTHERVMLAPIYNAATVHGVSPRVADPVVGLNQLLYFIASSPLP